MIIPDTIRVNFNRSLKMITCKKLGHDGVRSFAIECYLSIFPDNYGHSFADIVEVEHTQQFVTFLFTVHLER